MLDPRTGLLAISFAKENWATRLLCCRSVDLLPAAIRIEGLDSVISIIAS